jgi:hypothetical protein
VKKVFAFLFALFAAMVAAIALFVWWLNAKRLEAIVTNEVVSANYVTLRKLSASERFCFFPVSDLMGLWISENLDGYRSVGSVDSTFYYEPSFYWIILMIDDDRKTYAFHLVEDYKASYKNGRVCVKDLKLRLEKQRGEKSYSVIVESP